MELAFELPLNEDEAPNFEVVPDAPGVIALTFGAGPPYLCRTALLRRRLRRLLATGPHPSRWGNVRQAARRVFYQPAGSPFEAALLLYRLARRHRPDNYRRFLRLRTPPFVKVHLANEYPRTYITRKLAARRALFFGPFPSRVAAERFEGAFLDLFKIRRCRETIVPDPEHPGCIYGEMDMCLRPCQARSSLEEYRGEVGGVLDFLHTGGDSLLRIIEQERDHASESLEFEDAARQHRKLQKVRETLKLKDELARDIDELFGVVVQPSVSWQAVELWMLYKGFLQPRLTFPFGVEDGKPVSLDRKLRDVFGEWEPSALRPRERADHLALLSRWYYSSWRSGEIVLFDRVDRLPYRRLVNAISRVAAASQKAPQG